MPGHVKDSCWKLHGKPADWKPKAEREGRGNMTTYGDSPTAIAELFSKEQLNLLQKLISQQPQSIIASGSLAHSGNQLTALNAKQVPSECWIIDSGASDHMTGDVSVFTTYTPCHNHLNIRIADGSLSKVAGIGSVAVTNTIILDSVLFVPKLDCNLLSVRKLTQDKKCIAKFSPKLCLFQDLGSGRTIGSARVSSGLYYLIAEPSVGKRFIPTACGAGCSKSSRTSNLVSRPYSDKDVLIWHYRLGHLSFPYLSKLFPVLFRNKNPLLFQCEICQLAKHTRSTYSISPYKSSKPFSIIHSDVWGPSRVPNITGAKWFVSFVDDHTRLTWIYLMKEKSEVTHIFKCFKKMIQTQFDTGIQIFRTDNGKEFFNSFLGNYLSDEGIVHQSTCVDTPQQNGIAERKNRHLLEVARSLMFSSNVPKNFWGEAVLTAAFLINWVPSKVLNYFTPSKILQKFYPQDWL